uniref:Uncharacterized protein n=1 Tax=Heterorhabditis bacteriophora TaxID=37862 RepID=A0A1I7WUP1_HETBA
MRIILVLKLLLKIKTNIDLLLNICFFQSYFADMDNLICNSSDEDAGDNDPDLAGDRVGPQLHRHCHFLCQIFIYIFYFLLAYSHGFNFCGNDLPEELQKMRLFKGINVN